MKIRIIQSEDNAILGKDYMNLCLFPPTKENVQIQPLSPNFVFDEYACDSEVTELQLIDVIEFIPTELLLATLEYFLHKIRNKGTLILVGTDALQICKQFAYRNIELEELNFVLYGTQLKKQSMMTLDRMVSYLEKQGFKVLKKDLSGIFYTIVATKG